MLGNNRGRDYDVYEGGERVLSVRYLTPTEPSDCCMCGRSTFDHFAVPYYCGPVRSGKSEGGYAPACQRCYDRWARWDDGLEEYDSWLAVLREGASGVGGRPWSVYQHDPGCFSVARTKGDDLEYATDKTLTEQEARRRCEALNAGVPSPDGSKR